MQFICSHGFRMLVAPLESFRMDLGMAYTKKDDKGHLHSNIKDVFVLNFSKDNFGTLYKVGVLGPVSLYTYSYLPEDELWIFKNGEKNIIKYDSNEAGIDIEKYLAKIIWEIESK